MTEEWQGSPIPLPPPPGPALLCCPVKVQSLLSWVLQRVRAISPSLIPSGPFLPITTCSKGQRLEGIPSKPMPLYGKWVTRLALPWSYVQGWLTMPSSPVTRASSAVLTALARCRACSRECCRWNPHSWPWNQFSWLPEVSRSKGQGEDITSPKAPFLFGGVGLDLLHSYPWGQLACVPTTRASSTVLPRQSAGPTLLSAATGERWGQISILMAGKCNHHMARVSVPVSQCEWRSRGRRGRQLYVSIHKYRTMTLYIWANMIWKQGPTSWKTNIDELHPQLSFLFKKFELSQWIAQSGLAFTQ